MDLKVVIVDEDVKSLVALERICSNSSGVLTIKCFQSPNEALEYIQENSDEVNMIFSEIEMDEMTGIELASRIHTFNEDINVIFVTANPQYAYRAFEVDAMGYLLKPADPVQISKQIVKLTRRVAINERPRIFVRTFGHFDVFVGAVAVRFSSAKSKELLALLVDRRGGVVTMQQAIETLWPDRAYDDSVRSLYRNILQSLREALQDAGITEIFVNDRNSRSVNTTMFECDFYQLLDGKARGITSYNGEYMKGYIWGAATQETIKEQINAKV